MPRLRLSMISALMLLAVGCSTLPLPTGPEPRCLAPGVSPAFLAWPIRMAAPAIVQEMVGLAVRYAQGEQAVLVLWHADRLVYVDPDPDGTASPWRRLSHGCHWTQTAMEPS